MDPIEHDSLIMECGFARTNTKQAVCADPGMNLCIWTDPVSSSLFRPIKKRKKLFTSLELCSWARFPTHAEPMRHCCFLSPHINFSYASSSPHPLYLHLLPLLHASWYQRMPAYHVPVPLVPYKPIPVDIWNIKPCLDDHSHQPC